MSVASFGAKGKTAVFMICRRVEPNYHVLSDRVTREEMSVISGGRSHANADAFQMERIIFRQMKFGTWDWS